MAVCSLILFLLTCAIQCRLSYEARILLTTGANFGSHFSVFSKVGDALAGRGHKVTALISDAYVEKGNAPVLNHLKFKIDTYNDSYGQSTREYTDAYMKQLINGKSSRFNGLFSKIPPNLYSAIGSCMNMINHFENKEHPYDIFILDGHSSCSVFLAGLLRVPYIIIIPSGIKPSLARLHGIPDTSSYYPEMSNGLSYRMTFSERISNTISGFVDDIALFFEYRVLHFLLSMRYSISKPVRNLVSGAQLILVNSDISVDYPFPLFPNVITVGGLTTRPHQPLTDTWKSVMDSSGDHGVILFTLGTYIGSTLTLSQMETFSRAFAALPQLVIWQMKEHPPTALRISENTRIVSWMPQNDLLGHPKLKALVFHGGNNGMYEALYHGVPMVVMPLICDTPDVAIRIIDRGMGVKVDFLSFTSEELTKAIKEVINNISYKKNVLRWSAVFKANPQAPMERAVYWIEHVLKYGGDYLRTSRTDLYVWQAYSIDVYIFLFFVAYLCYKIVRLLYIQRYGPRSRLRAIIGFPLLIMLKFCSSLCSRLNMRSIVGSMFWRRLPPRDDFNVV